MGAATPRTARAHPRRGALQVRRRDADGQAVDTRLQLEQAAACALMEPRRPSATNWQPGFKEQSMPARARTCARTRPRVQKPPSLEAARAHACGHRAALGQQKCAVQAGAAGPHLVARPPRGGLEDPLDVKGHLLAARQGRGWGGSSLCHARAVRCPWLWRSTRVRACARARLQRDERGVAGSLNDAPNRRHARLNRRRLNGPLPWAVGLSCRRRWRLRSGPKQQHSSAGAWRGRAPRCTAAA